MAQYYREPRIYKRRSQVVLATLIAAIKNNNRLTVSHLY